jgi:hypothetical protein
MKKGQVTIFIILSLLIVGSIVVFFVYKNSQNMGKLNTIPEAQLNSIRERAIQCVELTGIDGIRLVGLQGGYVFPPEGSVETNFSNIAYGYYEGGKTLPSLSVIQKEISYYLSIAFPLCFDEEGFEETEVHSSKINSKVKISNDSVSIAVNYILAISVENATSLLKENYEREIPIRLGLIYREANEMIQREIEDSDYIDLSSLMNSEYEIAILPYSENILVYSITDNRSQIDGVPYTFMFANKIIW